MGSGINIAGVSGGGGGSSINLGNSIQNAVRTFNANINNEGSLHAIGDNTANVVTSAAAAAVGSTTTTPTYGSGTTSSGMSSTNAIPPNTQHNDAQSANQNRPGFPLIRDNANRFVIPVGSQHMLLPNNGDIDTASNNSAFFNMLRFNGNHTHDPRLFPHIAQGIPAMSNYSMLTPENLSITDHPSIMSGQQFLMNSAQNRTLRNRKKSSDSSKDKGSQFFYFIFVL